MKTGPTPRKGQVWQEDFLAKRKRPDRDPRTIAIVSVWGYMPRVDVIGLSGKTRLSTMSYENLWRYYKLLREDDNE